MGLIGWFNIWDSQLTSSEITKLNPAMSGNVVNWETLEKSSSQLLVAMSLPDSVTKGVPGIKTDELMPVSACHMVTRD